MDLFDKILAIPSTPKALQAPEVPKARKEVPAPPRKPGEESLTFVGPDGRLCVGVWLDGALGLGKRAIVNYGDWQRVRVAHGDRWTLREVRSGRRYVVGMGKARGLTLARVLSGAVATETVALRDGDPLNLCRGNLEVMEAGAFVERALRGRKDT